MASFDFIDASAKGYEFVWRERKYLARVAIPVLFLKTACFLSVFVLGLHDKFLQQGLILMPGTVVEALFMVGLVRYVLYREPIHVWGRVIPVSQESIAPYRYTGSMGRAQCIQAGFAMYLLLRVLETGVTGWIWDSVMAVRNITPASVAVIPDESAAISPLLAALILFGVLCAILWVYRFFWLYVPIVMGYSWLEFVRCIKGFQISISMFATMLICVLPFFVLFTSGIQLIAMFGGAAQVVLGAVFNSIADVVIVSIQVAAMTFGISQILLGKEKNR